MTLYEPDSVMVPQPGSVAEGSKQVRAALEGYLALRGRITLDTKLVLTVGDLAYLSQTWSLSGTGSDGNPVTLGATTAEVARARPTGRGGGDRQRLGRPGRHRLTGWGGGRVERATLPSAPDLARYGSRWWSPASTSETWASGRAGGAPPWPSPA